MNKKKLAKLIREIDPEPKFCYPTKCGYWEIERTRTIFDVIAEKKWIDAPRNNLSDYRSHSIECVWAAWALREATRKNRAEISI